MNDSMAQPVHRSALLEMPAWKSWGAWTCAVLMAALFLVAGLWKITDPQGAAVRLAQAKVPEFLSLPAAISLGIAETFSAVLLLVPRFRRWGSLLMSLLLLAFMIYIGLFYSQLQGEECSCFPWVKRAVGPGFFIGDAIMLLLAGLAGWWAAPSNGIRPAALVLAAVTVFAGVSFGVGETRQQGVRAPATITVDGRKSFIASGKVVLYFFDPECMHCIAAAKKMATLNWGATRVVGVPTQQFRFGAEFMQSTGLKGGLSPDLEPLKKLFPFTAPPAAVALENGVQKKMLTQFEDAEPAATLKKLSFIE